MGLGLQPFQGLFSPYVEYRHRYTEMTGEFEFRVDHSSGSRGSLAIAGIPSFHERAVVVGNTFHLGGLVSSLGPHVTAPIVDVGYRIPFDSELASSLTVSFGLAYDYAYEFDPKAVEREHHARKVPLARRLRFWEAHRPGGYVFPTLAEYAPLGVVRGEDRAPSFEFSPA